MADDCRDCGVGSVFLAFVLGAAVGGGVALLTAPRSGSETRDKLRDMADEARDRVREAADNAENRVKRAVDEGRELLDEKADLVKAAVKAGREAMEEERAKQEKPA